jgi:hypothetical protein
MLAWNRADSHARAVASGLHRAARMRFPILAVLAIPLVAAAGDPPRCEPGGNAELQACLDQAGAVKLIPPGTYRIDPAQAQVTINAFDGLKILGADPDDPPKIACERAADGRPVELNSNNGLTVVASNATVTGVEIAHLDLRDCFRGLLVSGSGVGRFEGLSIHDLKAKNSVVGLLLAQLQSAVISGNRVMDSDVGMVVAGVSATATVVVSGNTLLGMANQPSKGGLNIGISASNVTGEIRRNVVRHFTVWTATAGRGIGYGRGFPGDYHLDIYENEIHDVQIGIATGGLTVPRRDASGNPTLPDGTADWPFRTRATGRIWGNEVSHYEYHAITAFHGARGWEIWDNDFVNGPRNDWNDAWTGDVLLMSEGIHGHNPSPDGWGSRDTSLRLSPGQTVANPGNLTILTE